MVLAILAIVMVNPSSGVCCSSDGEGERSVVFTAVVVVVVIRISGVYCSSARDSSDAYSSRASDGDRFVVLTI